LVTRQGTQPAFQEVPALVNVADFEAVAEQLAKNRQRQRQRQAGAHSLLRGLMVCAECGYTFHGLPRYRTH
jgi:site-specific DNA recombinase